MPIAPTSIMASATAAQTPLHHIANQVLHIHDRRDEISPVNQRFIQRGQRKISPDAVGYQSEMLALLFFYCFFHMDVSDFP